MAKEFLFQIIKMKSNCLYLRTMTFAVGMLRAEKCKTATLKVCCLKARSCVCPLLSLPLMHYFRSIAY